MPGDFAVRNPARLQVEEGDLPALMQTLAGYLHEGSAIRRRTTHHGTGSNAAFHTDFSFDVYGRMVQIEQSFSPAASVGFEYDLASNLTKEVYQKQGGSNQVGDRFQYDEHHRLQKAWLGVDQTLMAASDPNVSVGNFVQKLTYGLDAANNRTMTEQQSGVGGPIVTQPYSVQNLGEPQGPSNRYDQVGGIVPTYDQRGNTTFDGNLYYVYDDQNRLTEVYTLVGGGGGQAGGESMASRSAAGGTLEPASRERFVVSNLGALVTNRGR
jgi:hypothetical protein